jgi:pilus assembly protein CpaF
MIGPLAITIDSPEAGARRFEACTGVFPIGSDPANRIVLPGEEVDWRHAVMILMEEEARIEALSNRCPVTVNGERVETRRRIAAGDRIGIGPYTLWYDEGAAPGEAAPPPAPAAPLPPAPPPAPAPPEPPDGGRRDVAREVKRQIQRELLDRLDLKRLTIRQVQAEELKRRIRDTLESIVGEIRGRLPEGMDRAELVREMYNEAVGLGPLEDFFGDPEITEIMVNGPDRIYVEKGGKLFLTGKTFMDAASVHAVIERIVSPIGRRIDESQPYVDARLPDGSRVNAIVSPLSLSGPCLTIRLFSKEPFTMENLIERNSITREVAEFLEACVKLRRNIVVSGGTGSGKTTLLNVISRSLPKDERIITIEDAAELRLPQEHVIRLEARPPNIEGRGAIPIRDLVRNALRMRPDRIVVGECRGGEALDMLQAMNTGHEGSLTTVHANSPRDALSRLETMVLMAGMDLPLRAIREQIGSAIHLVVHIARFSDGSRKVSRVSEVVGLEADRITMQDIFEFRQTGVDERGRVQGRTAPTGAVPTFLEDLEAHGLRVDRRIFGGGLREGGIG